jgi:hypothetical protein
LQAAEKDAAGASTKRSPDEGAASFNANEVLMLHSRLKIIQARAAQTNKAGLEAEKQRDELHNQIEQIEEQLQPKKTRTHADAGDAHEMLAEVDNWDLRDHHREGTRVQNRRNSQVGSRDNQQKPRTGKDGFLLHTRLGLVGWIAYWSCGDAALAVVILVPLINTLGLTELVSDALGSRKQKEAETNAKIVDLLKHALDKTKNCRNEQQRVEFHIPVACVMSALETQGEKKSKKNRKKKGLGAQTSQRMRRFPCLQDCLLTLTCHLAHWSLETTHATLQMSVGDPSGSSPQYLEAQLSVTFT